MTDLKILAAGTILAALTQGSSSASAQSFNCLYARLPAEIAICRSPELRSRDREMARDYFSLNNPRRENQVRWLRMRNACDYNVACLREAYDEWDRAFNYNAFGEN